jgi:hypothetical protein
MTMLLAGNPYLAWPEQIKIPGLFRIPLKQ